MKILFRKVNNQDGFSLIEMLVGVTISSIVLLMIYGAHRTIMFAVHDMSGIAEFYENVNLAIRRIDRDFSCTLQNKTNEKLFLIGENSPHPPYTGKINLITVLKSDLLINGSFTTPAYSSDVKEISYFLKKDPLYDDLFFLIRREALEYDDKPDEGGTESILLENVEDIRFEFTETKINDWSSKWNTKERNRYPRAIKVTLTLRNYRGTTEVFTFTSLLNRFQ